MHAVVLEKHGEPLASLMSTLPTDAMVMQGTEFIGTLGMPPTRYGEIFQMVSTGKLELRAVVSETVNLDNINEALDKMTDFSTVGIPVIESF